MDRYERVMEEMLAPCGVRLNGNAPHDVKVRNPDFCRRVLGQGSLGLGESYMDGWWECEALDEFFARILSRRLDEKARLPARAWPAALLARLTNRQSRRRAENIARAHYDLGNDLFAAFLDEHNQYSCAYFKDTDDLDEAQRQKLDLILDKLGVGRGDRVLDIGCGWGGLARYAAKTRGCEVVGVTVSGEQAHYAARCCRALPVRVLKQDYRELDGEFDAVVSVGMFEHVGPKNYRTFMRVVADRLAPNAAALVHTIGANETSQGCDPWISRYIFPDGHLPSVAQVARAAETHLVIEDVHNLGEHYAKTLWAWHERFERAWPELAGRYSERFRRMWRYYLLSCSGAFRARAIQLWQFVLTRRGDPQPGCCRAS